VIHPQVAKRSVYQDVGTVRCPSVSLAVLRRCRRGFYDRLSSRADALVHLTDALAWPGAPVTDLARLSLQVEYRRGHGALYDGLDAGMIDTGRLRARVGAGPLPKLCRSTGRR
jgi:hypothetical protein